VRKNALEDLLAESIKALQFDMKHEEKYDTKSITYTKLQTIDDFIETALALVEPGMGQIFDEDVIIQRFQDLYPMIICQRAKMYNTYTELYGFQEESQ
jgi:hypothetical protein